MTGLQLTFSSPLPLSLSLSLSLSLFLSEISSIVIYAAVLLSSKLSRDSPCAQAGMAAIADTFLSTAEKLSAIRLYALACFTCLRNARRRIREIGR